MVLANDTVSKISALENNGGQLWIREDQLKKATGFDLKPSGACYESLNICIPLFEKGFTQKLPDGKWLNVSKLAERLDQACISNDDKTVWSLGLIPEARNSMIETGMAPDFEITDIHGNLVRLSDFRGKKVLIVTWATWCGCRFDVKSWQELYEELNDPDFEIICVAEDSQGEAVAKKWFINANATFNCIVDPTHKISTVFGWVNVPTGAWIDEEGKLIRINEAAYAGKHKINNLLVKTEFGNTAFGDATKEWVKNGLNDKIKQSTDTLHANIRSRSKNDLLADANFKMGLYFQNIQDKKNADKYLKVTQDLCPDNWNYHRQSWTFKSTMHAIKNWKKKTTENYNQSENWTYYQPMDLENAPTRRTTKMEFIWTTVAKKCKQFFKAG